jgi:hypothetical protein
MNNGVRVGGFGLYLYNHFLSKSYAKRKGDMLFVQYHRTMRDVYYKCSKGVCINRITYPVRLWTCCSLQFEYLVGDLICS